MAKPAKVVSLSKDPDLYFHTQAADLISDQEQHTAGMRKQFADEMFKAIHDRKLPAYSHRDGSLFPHLVQNDLLLCVRPADINEWLKKAAYDFRWHVHIQSGMAPALGQQPCATSLTAQRRQAKRWQACIDAGLDMPKNIYSRYPRGITKVAESLNITRQSLGEDLDKHRERIFRP
jgi:hypothetical protein